MKNNIPYLFSLLLILPLLTGFSRHDQVKIKILQPSPESVFKNGDTIFISADLQSESAIHDIAIRISSRQDSSVVYSKVIHTHSNFAQVREYFVFSAPVQVPLTLSIQTKGHSGSASSNAEVHFAAGGKKKKR